MTPAAFDVVGIGNAIVDVLTHVDDAFIAAQGLVKGSMALVDADRSDRLYAAMGPGVEVSGGTAANTMAGIASLGGRVAYVGKVRDDQLGEVFAHDIRAAGVSYATAPATDGPGTARCLILLTPDAERTMNTYLGASVELEPGDVDAALVASSAVTYCEGYLWDAPAAKAAITAGMDAARSAGRQVAFTLSDGFCVDRHRREFSHLVGERVHVLFANETEICSLFEVNELHRAVDAVRGHCRLACVTRGERGSVLVTAEEAVEVPAHPVALVIDTTGAGDLYAAGVLFGLTHDLDLETCGRLGSLAAAEVISHVGARPEVSLADLAQRELGLRV